LFGQQAVYTEGQFETRWITKEGLLKDIFLQVSQSSSCSHIVTASDITEIKKVQNDLSVSESRLRAIIDSAQDSIFIKDKELHYIDINPAMEKLFGMSCRDILGKSDVDLFGESKGHQIEEIDRRVLSGEIIKEQTERSVQGSPHIFDMIKVPLHDEKGDIIGLCGIARDITERRNLEFQLAQSQKIEAIGTLAGGVAHDFNNIIGAIMGYASLVQVKMDPTDIKSTYVRNILSASEKAANLTQSLLAFSRKQLIRLKPVGMNETIEHIQKILTRLLTEDIEFKTKMSEEDLTVLADEGQIDQVIMNLVTNARDAMPRGGSLTITTSPFTIDDEFIRTCGFGKKGQYARISLADTGKGIDADIRAKIFEPFFTTKEVGKGTGLGLSLVYGIVKQHNGFIEVNSKINIGTVFHIYLPLTQDAVEPKGSEFQKAEIIGGTETVLVAEDNAELANVVKTVLSEKGYQVILARDGLEAISLFHENRIDLAILDVVMPKKNGWEVYGELKKADSHIKVLFVSGYTDDIIQEKGLIQEGIDLEMKPLSHNRLLTKVREILDRKQ
jgi:PAS domain S-box-containing protein